MLDRMAALVRKEFIQIRRDRRTLAMMILIPLVWLLVFGYAASFDVRHIRTALAGSPDDPVASLLASALDRYAPDYFDIVAREDFTRAELEDMIRLGEVQVAIIPPAGDGEAGYFLADGTDLFAAQTAARQLQVVARSVLEGMAGGGSIPFETVILFNPELRSANFMIPGLVGAVMVFIATIMTAVGVVRERERGTLEQLLVTPLGPFELMVGKIVPYLVISFVDLLIVIGAGVWIFHVPFAGSPLLLLGLSLLFLFTCLGLGVLVSTVSQTQQQAMQLAVFTLLPQILMSGFIFPLAAIPWAVRWVAYLMPLTYFVPIARGTFLKDVGLSELWLNAVILAGYAVVVVTLAALRFRRRMV